MQESVSPKLFIASQYMHSTFDDMPTYSFTANNKKFVIKPNTAMKIDFLVILPHNASLVNCRGRRPRRPAYGGGIQKRNPPVCFTDIPL